MLVGGGRELLCSLRRRLARAFTSLSRRPDTFFLSSLHLFPRVEFPTNTQFIISLAITRNLSLCVSPRKLFSFTLKPHFNRVHGTSLLKFPIRPQISFSRVYLL